MRIVIALLLLACSIRGFGQNLLDQKFDFAIEEQTIAKALLLLSEDTKVRIAFSSSQIESTEKFTLTFQKETLRSILSSILSSTNLLFKESRSRIIIYQSKSKEYTISGFVKDATSGERLISASVYCPELKIGTVSNDFGFYSLALPSKDVDLEFSYIGYESQKTSLSVRDDMWKNVSLQPAIQLPEVTIMPDEDEVFFHTHGSFVPDKISNELVVISPDLGGDADVLRTSLLLPGVVSASGNVSGLHVRGANSTHNLMLLNGVTVYIPFHYLGLLSTYNSSTIQSSKFFRGHIPARFGGRLASVMDIRSKEGNLNNYRVEVGSSITAANALVEGPIKRGKASFLVAGRIAHNNALYRDVLARALFYEENDVTDFSSGFSDLNVKLNFLAGDKDRFYFSFYYGADQLDGTTELSIEDVGIDYSSRIVFDWDNSVSSLRWNHVYNHKLFSNLTFNYSKFGHNYSRIERLQLNFGGNENFTDGFFIQNASNNRDIGLTLDFDFEPSSRHKMKFGTGAYVRDFIPDINIFKEDSVDNALELDTFSIFGLRSLGNEELIRAYEFFAYAEDRITISKLILDAGLRVSAFINDKSFLTLEPRLSAKYLLRENLTLAASVSRNIQFLHLISNPVLRFPNDLWFPSTDMMRPSESLHADVGVQYNLNNQISFGASLYFKKLNNLYAYEDGFTFTTDQNDVELDEILTEGQGRAYGLEMIGNLSFGKLQTMLNYTVSVSERQYDQHNGGLWYPYEYDQRHQFKIYSSYEVLKNLYVSAQWRLNSPGPKIVLSTSDVSSGAITIPPSMPGEKNSERLKLYHRLDLSMYYTLQTGSFKHHFKAGVYNLYDRKNELYYSSDEFFGTESPVYALPIMPSVSYKLVFQKRSSVQ